MTDNILARTFNSSLRSGPGHHAWAMGHSQNQIKLMTVAIVIA